METIVLQKMLLFLTHFNLFLLKKNFIFYFFEGVMNRQITIPIINA